MSDRNQDLLTDFFAYLLANGRARGRLGSPTEYPEPLSVSTVEGYRSAFVTDSFNEGYIND